MSPRPSKDEINRRWDAAIHAERLTGDYRLHWLSFADPRRPKGSQFLGVALVWAHGFAEAVDLTHQMGINPGGEVAGSDYEPGELVAGVEWWNRLLSAGEAEACEEDRVIRSLELEGVAFESDGIEC